MIDAKEWSNALQGKYIKFEAGEETVLVLRNWRLENKEVGDFGEKLCFMADVEELDGENVWSDDKEERRTVEMPSKRFQAEIKPIVLKAQEADRDRVKVRVIRKGEGAQTTYTITDLSKSLEGASASSSQSKSKPVKSEASESKSKPAKEPAHEQEDESDESDEKSNDDPLVAEAEQLAKPNDKDKPKVADARKKIGEIINLYRLDAVSLSGLKQVIETQRKIIEK